jgi:type II pantothenate kinase
MPWIALQLPCPAANACLQVSIELAEAAAGADLVVLEGMGRSIETNLRARFSCDSLNIGMIKHPEVAQALGGRLYDCVCQFRRA